MSYPSFVSNCPNYPDYMTQMLEPGGNARQTRRLLVQANEATTHEGFYSRCVKPLSYASIAWVNTIFDTMSFGTKYLRECAICLIECNYEELQAVSRETGWDLLCSAKLVVTLPVAIAIHILQLVWTTPYAFTPFAYTNYSIDERERVIEQLQRLFAAAQQQLIDQRDSRIAFCREATLLTHSIFTMHTTDEFPPVEVGNALEAHQEMLRGHIRRLMEMAQPQQNPYP